MSDGPLVSEDLVIVTTLHSDKQTRVWKNNIVARYLVRLVTEEMNLLEALVLHMPQAIGLVPAGGEDVERYLPTDREGKVVIGKLLLQDFYEGNPDAMDLSKPVRVCVSCGR